jgi:aminopeptidase N
MARHGAFAPTVLLAIAASCAIPTGRSTTAIWSQPPETPASGRAAVHHDVEVTLFPGDRRLTVLDTVRLSPELRARLGDTAVFSLHAGLSPQRLGPGAPLERVAGGRAPRASALSGEGRGVPLEFFAVTLTPDDETFTIRYGGTVFHPVEREGEEHARSMGYSAGLVTPEGALLSGATHWLPDLSDDPITFALEARVPAEWDAVSQGFRERHERSERGTIARWRSEQPQPEALLVAGPFFERSRTSGPVLLQTFLRAEEPALADTYLEVGARYLSMYEELLGAYPYPKFAVVENFWETGYGMPSFTLLGSKVVRFPFILHSSYPHEILHNWWGNGVLVEPARGNWAEGLTAYLADHLVQEQRGRGAEHRQASLQRYADYVSASEELAVREFRERHGSVTQAIGYDKVLMVFHMLRQRLGDERFVAGLRRFYETYRFRAASFPDLGRTMSAVAGEDLAPFFAQWVDRTGAPVIRLAAAEARRRDRSHVLELTLTQAQEGRPYAIDVPVYVTLASRPMAVRHLLPLADRRQRFTLELEDAPVRVDVDPEYDVLRRLDPAELPPTLGGAFGDARALVVLPSSATPELRAAYAAAAESWRRSGTEVVTDAEVAELPEGRAVWLLGWENRLREAIAPAVAAYGGTLSASALRAGASALARDAHAAVVAVRSPADPGEVVVFVGADDPEALPALARKLPHYGKYSLLGFEGAEAENVAKHTWPLLTSPMAAAVGAGAALPPRAALPARKALAELPERAR